MKATYPTVDDTMMTAVMTPDITLFCIDAHRQNQAHSAAAFEASVVDRDVCDVL
jgi:hypothetical protein